MGGLNAVAEDDPKRVAYRALHKRSTRAYGTALLFGIAQLALAATRANARESEIPLGEPVSGEVCEVS